MTKLDRLLKAYEGDAHKLPDELTSKPFTTLQDMDRRYRAIKNCGRQLPVEIYVVHSTKPTTH